jgi:hypothetical protein
MNQNVLLGYLFVNIIFDALIQAISNGELDVVMSPYLRMMSRNSGL